MKRSNKARGLALLEVITVIAIVVIIVAVSSPAMIRAKRSSLEAKNKVQLHNCQLAVSLYRIDHDYDSSQTLGLPHIVDILDGLKRPVGFYSTKGELWRSACGVHPSSSPRTYTYFPGELTTRELAPFHQLGDQTILIADEQCNEPETDVQALYLPKTGYGVLLDGTLVERRRSGYIDSVEFWHEDWRSR